MQALGRVPISVVNADVDDVVLQLAVPVQIDFAGKIEVEGNENARITGSVLLQPAAPLGFFGSGAPPARIQNDGTFKFERVPPAKYYINVLPLPEGAYLKQVRAGPADVLETGLDLSEPGSAPKLEILIGSKPATVEGIVRGDDKPWPGASVTLLPEPPSPDLLRRLLRTSVSGQDGRFTLKGIAPGKYRLIAWEEAVSLADLDPEELKPYESYLVEIKVDEGERRQVELNLAKPQP